MPNHTPKIQGADAVVGMLGEWPSFHDAEILRFHIERDGVSSVSIQLVGPDGRCETGSIVTFSMELIHDLALEGEDINRQNVLSALSVETADKGTRVIFGPCYGLAGHITAETVTVTIEPVPTASAR